MTIDLNMMIDLRDVQVALDVARRAEMGWFDVEFTMYGCAYREKGKRYYRISAYEEKIYDFIENSAVKGIFPSDICVLSRKYPVPAGMQESAALDVKKELAEDMAKKFPLDFFADLENLADQAAEETALPMLQEQMQQIDGCFDPKKISRFQTMVEYAYLNRKIGRSSYQKLQEWLADEQRSMEENIVAKDIFEKTFYAVAYEAQGSLKYLINARRGYIYRKKYELEMQGIFVSPLFADTYYYSYTTSLPQVRKMFEQDLKSYVDQEYLSALQCIYTHNAQVSAEEFSKCLRAAEEKYGPQAAQTLRHYGCRWGIL